MLHAAHTTTLTVVGARVCVRARMLLACARTHTSSLTNWLARVYGPNVFIYTTDGCFLLAVSAEFTSHIICDAICWSAYLYILFIHTRLLTCCHQKSEHYRRQQGAFPHRQRISANLDRINARTRTRASNILLNVIVLTVWHSGAPRRLEPTYAHADTPFASHVNYLTLVCEDDMWPMRVRVSLPTCLSMLFGCVDSRQVAWQQGGPRDVYTRTA